MNTRHLRFYEQDPSVKQAMELFFAFPNEVQVIIASAFSFIAERDYKAKEILSQRKSLGTDKVLALYNSQKKRRKYDQVPQIHQGMKYLLVMKTSDRVFIAKNVMEIIGFIQNYLHICHGAKAQPALNSIQEISGAYVEMGPAGAQEFLKTVEEEFKAILLGKASKIEAKAPQAIQPGQSGLRLKGDNPPSPGTKSRQN